MAAINADEFIRLTSLSAIEGESSRSTPYEEYFGEMELDESEKKDRIKMAQELENEVILVLSLLSVMIQYDIVNAQNAVSRLRAGYADVAAHYMDVDDYLSSYIDVFSWDAVDATIRNKGDPYYTSMDRAMFISENEANTTLNYRQYINAVLQGKTKKQWVDVRDKRERKTHRRVGGRTKSILLPFEVGDSLMMFPKDTSLGADASEIVNCRCSVKYL